MTAAGSVPIRLGRRGPQFLRAMDSARNGATPRAGALRNPVRGVDATREDHAQSDGCVIATSHAVL